MKHTLVILATAVVASGGLARAENWPAWRGGGGNGTVEDQGAPTSLSMDKNLKWKVKLPGRGCSTPIVWDGQIVVTMPIGDEDGVVSYDWSGKELWRATLGPLVPGRGQRVGSAANSSPVTDGEHVFAYFKSGNLAALTMDGKVVWKINLIEKYGKDYLWWDQGTSPILAGGNLVVAVMQSEGETFLLSVDKKTGKEVWRTDRKYETGAESGDAYTTPHVVELDGVETIVTWGADHVTGHDAKNGKLLWEVGDFNPTKMKAWRVIASAAVTDGVAVVPFKRGDAMAGIRLGGKGDMTQSAWLWRKDGFGSDAATPAARDGKAIVLKDSGRERGQVMFLDVKSGREIWKEELPKSAKIYYASPVVSGTTLYLAREDGTIFSGTVTAKGLENLVESRVGETVIATPVALNGCLLVRGDQHLFCFERP